MKRTELELRELYCFVSSAFYKSGVTGGDLSGGERGVSSIFFCK